MSDINMFNIEDVIHGLEKCIIKKCGNCMACPYFDEPRYLYDSTACSEYLMKDALFFLKILNKDDQQTQKQAADEDYEEFLTQFNMPPKEQQHCSNCKYYCKLEKTDFTNKEDCRTKLDGYVCLLYAHETAANWWIGVDPKTGTCEDWEEVKRDDRS